MKFVILLLISLPTLGAYFPPSPCPGFFQYITDEKTRETYGRIQIPFPPRKTILVLRVWLTVAGILPTEYSGKVELARSLQDSVIAVDQGQPIIYKVTFPVQWPRPLLAEIRFNDIQYCIGPRTMGLVTVIYLEHTLRPPEIFPISNNYSSSPPPYQTSEIIYPNIFSSTTTTTSTTFAPTTSDPIQFPENSDFSVTDIMNNDLNQSCGCPAVKMNDSEENILPEQWPWFAAIFFSKSKLEYRCAGSLISNRHVITAAHCMYYNRTHLAPTNVFIVKFGLDNLDSKIPGVDYRFIREFNIHPDYKNGGSSHADLAIIVLQPTINTTPKIQPICLWMRSKELEHIVGQNAFLVGFGKNRDGNRNRAELRIARVPIVSQEKCLRSNANFIYITSNKTFCAGHRDETDPCNSDIGSGLALRDSTTSRYLLRGIVSFVSLDENTRSCDLSQYIVYTDVAKFSNWIESQIS